MVWLTKLIRLLYRRRRFYFRTKNYFIYYFKSWLLGVSLGFVVYSVWHSFLGSRFTPSLLSLDKLLVDQYESITVLWLNLQARSLIILVILTLLLTIIKGFQLFLKGSLIYLGFLTWLLINKHNYFTNPNFWQEWNTRPKSSLTVIFYAVIWIVISDIILLVAGAILNQIKISIKPHVTSFINNLRESITINVDKLKIPIIVKNPKQWWNEAVDVENNLFDTSDEPLKDLSEIEQIQETIDNPDLFNIFIKAIDDLKNIILNMNNKTGLANSVCLDGPWGSGKTSLINIVHNDILKINDSKIVWIDFEPWNFNSSTELIKDFFETLNNQLIKKYKVDLQPNLSFYVDLVTPLIESTGLTSNLKSVLTRIPLFAPRNLANLKIEIIKQLKRIPDKIVIVLDDLDRLKFDEVQIVLKLVRQLSNLPNIIFVLPFDYERVSNLIVREMGDGYRDFLGKIINDRIKLDSYSYSELEGVFVNHIKQNPSDVELSALKETFCCYVKEKNRIFFDIVRKLVDQAKQSKGDALMFDFANDFFRVLYPDLLLKDKFSLLKDRVKNLLNFYLNDSSKSGDSLVLGIFEEFSVVKKADLASDFKIFKPQSDQDIPNAGMNDDETKSFNEKWDNFIGSLSSFEKYEVIESRLKEMENFPTLQSGTQFQTLPNTKSALDSIRQALDDYKKGFEDNSQYNKGIKDFLVNKLTPRQVKGLARSESEYITSIIGSKELMIKRAISVAKMQY